MKSNHVYKKGYMRVSGGHELYYELYGNPKIKPVLFIHGGPGSGFSEKLQGLFDPEKFNMIFYDQRGAGKSKPYLSLHENTTEYLVEDIEALLNFLDLKKVIVVGASWGATLGLLYAIKYPERVESLVLMSVFLGTKSEIQFFVDGSTAKIFPECWKRFISIVPEDKQSNAASFYLDKMLHGSDDEKEKYFFNWVLYDMSLSTGIITTEKLEKPIHKMYYESLALLTAYYIVNNFFLPEGYIFKNLHKIQKIPISVIQGKFDAVTPARTAIELCKHLPHASLELVESLHAGKEIKGKFIKRIAALL